MTTSSAFAVPIAGARAHAAERNIGTRERILLGGAGALTPILLNALLVDTNTVFAKLTAVVALSYALRVIILFLLGSINTWLHEEEKCRKKLWQLGMAGPALVTTLLNGSSVERHSGSRAQTTNVVSAAISWIAPREAFAAQQLPVYSFRDEPPESVAAQLLRGLTGISLEPGRRFVIVKGEYRSAEDAFAKLPGLRQRTGLEARVYKPDGPSQAYLLVIGDWLSEKDAIAMEREAAGRGLPAYIWSPPA